MDSTEPSNKTTVALVLKNRGFRWNSPGLNEVISKSSTISFDDEWNEFMKVVQAITGISQAMDMIEAENSIIATEGTETHALQAEGTSVASIASYEMTTETSQSVPNNITLTTASANFAWNCFKQVIDPISFHPALVHDSGSFDDPTIVGDSVPVSDRVPVVRGGERSFDIALFKALRESLNGFVDNTVDSNWIILKNSIIGFGRNIQRDTLGYEKGYVLSGDSESDHSCFVLGREAIGKLKTRHIKNELTQKRKCKASKYEADLFWFNDITATVELKLESSSCASFKVIGDSIEVPSLAKSHSPMGQAIMYTMDTWHCLARRGVSVESVPVVVLAGRREKQENLQEKKQAKEKKEDNAKPMSTMVCCLEAHVQIPLYFGTSFIYSVDRIVLFNGTTGLIQDEVPVEMETRDKRAIAIYIKTMRFGLVNALAAFMNRRDGFNSVPPASLCCHTLLKGETSATLIASPIPREEHQWKPGIRISQGEFFQIERPTKSMFSGFVGLRWFDKTKQGNIPLTNDCIVKVSCASVHNIYVPPAECNLALTQLFYEGKKKLKAKIAQVLLGYCYTGDSKSIISIMKNLGTGDKTFTVLEHRNLPHDKLCMLWDGFSDLINSLLLPMADLNVIHLDIRSSSEITYNLLMHENDTGIELCLVDFDSIILYNAASAVDEKGQNNAIWWNQLGVNQTSAYKYLFWQVLWIAYRWHPSPEARAMGTHQENGTANSFVSYLFQDDKYNAFKRWLGDHYMSLIQLNAGNITRKEIQGALGILGKAFKELLPTGMSPNNNNTSSVE